MSTVQIHLPPKLIPVFAADNVRYRGAYGGRGSAKTRTFALMSAVRAYMLAEGGQSGVILCGREYMNSLEDSSMEEIKQAIKSIDWLNDYFDIGEKYIRTKNKKISYVFSGLRHNLDSIKSKARILIAWIDEAESVSETAWSKLLPTVREEDSEVWVTWNPERRESATDKRFRLNPPENSMIVEMNYYDNPFFPSVLEQERLNDKSRLDDAIDLLSSISKKDVVNKRYLVEVKITDYMFDGEKVILGRCNDFPTLLENLALQLGHRIGYLSLSPKTLSF